MATAWKLVEMDGDYPEFHAVIQGETVEAYTAKPSYRIDERFLCRIKSGPASGETFNANTLADAEHRARRILTRARHRERQKAKRYTWEPSGGL